MLDSLGVGEMPDAATFGDEGSNTLRSVVSSPKCDIPNLLKAGLGNAESVSFLPGEKNPLAAFGKMAEESRGKDTTIGHWELCGVISPKPLPTYPHGFPASLIRKMERRWGRRALCNRPFSGTEVIRKYGEEHRKTGALIVYTSADSVFQIAADEEIVPLSELYRDCEIAREILTGDHGVGRVIARPFVTGKDGPVRTANRHDFSLPPPGMTLLDRVKEQGLSVIAIGKIGDIFAHRGTTEEIRSADNREGMALCLSAAKREFEGLCFLNLVEFDSVYGHRNDVDGYALALSEFDAFLPEMTRLLREDDLLIVTADHGCDPGTPSTDHSREYVPLLVFGKGFAGRDLGVRKTFADVAATVGEYLDLPGVFPGKSFLREKERDI